MIYFDSAATTLQKPLAVAQSTAKAVNAYASPGRGGHPAAMAAAAVAYQCRVAAGELLGVSDPDRVIFTCNATHALNIAIASLVSPGDTVVISGWEHNAVTRPLKALGAKVKVARGLLFDPKSVLADFGALVTPEVKCVICTQCSNVFGAVLPIDALAALCRDRGVPLIVDASQSAGCLPVDLEGWGAAFVAMPGHKGLYGPQGTGLLLCGSDRAVKPLLLGGTGSASLSQEMPDFLPDRLEAGTHNIPGISGLLEGIRFVARKRPEVILSHERKLLAMAREGLSQFPGVELFCDPLGQSQTGVLSLRIHTIDCEEAAQWLGDHAVAVRAGLHCAPLAHETAGTLNTGTVRLSFSALNTPREVERFLNLMEQMVRKR